MKLDKQLIQIEAYKDDSNKCYQAIRVINSNKPKKPLIVHWQDMIYAGSEKEQANIISEYFKNMFTAVTTYEPIIIKPAEMKTLFTTEEIEKASKSMKNRKSVGEDGLNAEYVTYGPPEIHNGIAILLNTIAETLSGVMCSTSQCKLRSTFPNLRVANVFRIVTYYTLPPLESPDSSWMIHWTDQSF